MSQTHPGKSSFFGRTIRFGKTNSSAPSIHFGKSVYFRTIIALLWFNAHLLIIPACAEEQKISTEQSTPASAYGKRQDQKIRVALFVDTGTEAGDFIKEFRRNADDDVVHRKIDADEIRGGALRNFDALLIPGGSASRESASLGPEARDEIRRFVRDGGIYVGVCAGAYLASSEAKHDLGLLPVTTLDSEHWYRVDDNKEAVVDVELTPAGQEIFGIYKRDIRIVYCNGPIFAQPDTRLVDDSFTPLGFFRSEVVADGGQRGVMLGAPAMVLSRYGKGIVLAISPHPEETPGLKQAEIYALHWLYDHRNGSGSAIARSQPIAHQESKGSRGGIEQHSDLNEQALRLAKSVFDRASDVGYIHKAAPASRQIITQPDGTVTARTDCSGFISYIVKTIAPRHYHVVREREPNWSYPQAKIWARFFDTLNSDRPDDGWLAIRNWRDLKPGDLIAWVEGKESSSGNTGHVMMVLKRPDAVKQEQGYRYIEIPVIDSSTMYHFAPEYLPPNASQKHRNGLGEGSVRIILSDSDLPIGYWGGTYWGEGHKEVHGPTLSSVVRFARMVSLVHDDKFENEAQR